MGEGSSPDGPPGPLAGVRVIDAASVYAGPLIGTLMGDFGADVVKVESPAGDALRAWGWRKDDESLWWSLIGRHKRSVTLLLSDPRGAEALRRLVRTADVLVESFRPGTLERWGLGPETLLEINPRLVVVRVSGFGQTGPYRERPGFGTLAESMSGFAATNGEADGPPQLPQWPLADGVAGLVGAFAATMALRHAERTGQGQVVDLSIYEPLLWILGAQLTAYDQLGKVPERQGNATDFNVPRGCYRTADGGWVALSGATLPAARRILTAVGRRDLCEEPWFGSIDGRLAHRDELDAAIGAFAASRDREAVLALFAEAGATAAPVYDVADIAGDPHFLARGTVTRAEHPDWGPVLMQGLIARMSATPGRVTGTGPRLGEHTAEILGELGFSREALREMIRDGVVAPARDEPGAP
ncbi:MAG: CoA transferase [Streptosporangiales bacterium]|nr:CoA transferase [Streptosporangiales bacterium]